MIKKSYVAPSVEIDGLTFDVLTFSHFSVFDNLGDDKDDWEIPSKGGVTL